MPAKLTDIRVFHEYKGAKKGQWSIYDRETGKTISTRYYPTEQEALDAIPTEYNTYLKRTEYLETQHANAVAKQQAAERAHQAKLAAYNQGRDERGTYTTTRDGGRRYTNLPGATHYDATGSDRYGTQIWDEA